MRFRSLKSALLFSVAGVIVCTGLLICMVLIHRFADRLMDTVQVRAEAIAKKLALDLTDPILINDVVAIQKTMEALMASDADVAYIIITQHGGVLAHTFKNGVPTGLVEANRGSAGKDGHLLKIISETGDRYIDIALPIFEGRAGALRIGLSEAPYRRQVTALWGQMSLLALAILCAALVVTRLLIQRLLTPLTRLQQAAAEIDETRVDIRIDVKGREEVARLSDAFNGMLDRLQGALNRLRQSNTQLEARNRALDRAHNQLQASLTMSQQIAALSRLQDIGTHVIRTLRTVVQCRNMAIGIVDEERGALLVISENQPAPVYHDLTEGFLTRLNDIDAFGFLTDSDRGRLPVPASLKSALNIAVFPFRVESRPLGALMVGCTGECQCIQTELKVVGLLLNQTAGALNRALIGERETCTLRTRVEATNAYGDIVGKNPKMQIVYQLIEDVAPTDATVLILGESGTGKELVAKAIHQASERRNHPFVVINCSAYPSTLLESELFGHEKGAFTGATRRKIGRFELAHGGTVFLDEIGDITPTAQIKLLRVLQNHTIERVGGEKPISVDVRILAATNRNIEDTVKAGRFREDLFYRLNVIPIRLPPLNQRSNDIPLLAQHFLKRFSSELKKPLTGIEEETLRRLLEHPWPGNVRELENTIEHAVVLAKSAHIQPIDLPTAIRDRRRSETGTAPSPGVSAITQNEVQLIRDALTECGGNKTAAAARLGISRSTLYEKLKKYRIERRATLH